MPKSRPDTEPGDDPCASATHTVLTASVTGACTGPVSVVRMQISVCTGWGDGEAAQGLRGLLSASQAVSGVLHPARLRTGPCRAARVCVPAINIDGVDSACPCRGDGDVKAEPAVWEGQCSAGESTKAECSAYSTGRWDPIQDGGVGSSQMSKPRGHKPFGGIGQTCNEPKSCD